MFHKILILVAAVGAVSVLVNHFFNGAELDWNSLLIAGLVIVTNLRELQFDRIKEQYDKTLLTLESFRDAVLAECDDKTVDRIVLKQADNIVDMAPEEFRPELNKINDLLKKMHKFKYEVKHADDATNP